jgi:hypothetical protein
MYPILYFYDFNHRKAALRQAAQTPSMTEKVGNVLNATKDWVLKSCQKGLELVFNMNDK